MPSTVTDPAVGRSSPAISWSRVLLPAPLGATRPVRPSPTVKDRSVKTGVSSGQAKDRFEQTMEDMREISRGDTTGIPESLCHRMLSSVRMGSTG